MAKASRLSLISVANQAPDETSAYKFLEGLRWPNGPVCPHCGNTKAYYLNPANGSTRKTRTGSMSARRVWKCAACKKQFSVLTGTVMHGTKVSVRVWLLVFVEMCTAKNGISAREVQRKYDISAEAAWFVCHRIREAMKREPLAGLLSGTVTADETWIGGKPHNMHRRDRYAEDRPSPRERKTPVFSLVHRETGEVRSRVIPDVTARTLRAAIDEQVDLANTVLHTDNAMAYTRIGWKAREHHSVNHVLGEYVRGNVTTNHAESYFSQLKRSIDGTHHHVSREHLPRYLAQFDYLWSTCRLSDTARLERLMGRVAGRRLTYRPLRGQ